MTMNEYIENFKNEDFGRAFEVFRQGTKKAIEENMAQLMENARHTFSGFFAETARAMERLVTEKLRQTGACAPSRRFHS